MKIREIIQISSKEDNFNPYSLARNYHQTMREAIKVLNKLYTLEKKYPHLVTTEEMSMARVYMSASVLRLEKLIQKYGIERSGDYFSRN